MVQVRKELCLGCGLCAENCPVGAISLFWGRVEVDQAQCISCYQCLRTCPTGAISEKVPIQIEDLRTMVDHLQSRVAELIERIDKLSAKC